jgi:hypothetical protein
VTDDRWHLLVGTIRSARDSIKLYVDGALKKVLPAAVAPLSSGANPIPLEVGRWFRTGWGQPDFYFPGAVDEVRIYDEELSAASVAALYTGATAAVPIGDRPGLSIEGAPNPTRGSKLAVAFTLPGSEPARIALFDVAGRRVWSREVGALGAGRHQVDLADSRSLPSGTYLIQLTQGTHAVRGRVSVLR